MIDDDDDDANGTSDITINMASLSNAWEVPTGTFLCKKDNYLQKHFVWVITS